MILYNTGIFLYGAALKTAALFNAKARLWVGGRRKIFDHLRQATQGWQDVVWVHCASLGEFEQGRPLIEAIRENHPGYRILLTFFSPSGYEVRKDYPLADAVFYLPLDTPRNARRFIRTVDPRIAVFVKYEYWLNYLRRLRRSQCRTFVISAIFRPDSVFFKWYGGAFRRALAAFERFFVQNQESKQLLSTLGIENVTVSGDTRFDRVARIAANANRLPAVEKFAQGSRVVVAGSTWPHDEDIILQTIAAFPTMKFIVAPHEIDQERIERFIAASPRKAVRYTDVFREDAKMRGSETPITEIGADVETRGSVTPITESGVDVETRIEAEPRPQATEEAEVLVIDTIGILSSVYRYGYFGYIGGGFGAGIHNTLEAAAFGLPLAFGPNYMKFKEARDLIDMKAARSVSTFPELQEMLRLLSDDPGLYRKTGAKSAEYVENHRGATGIIMKTLFG